MKLILVACLFVIGVSTAPTKNIVELAQATPDLSTLVTALVAGNLTGALSGAGPFTVFAPTNKAFGKIPAATLKHLLDPKNIKELDAVLEYHVVAGAAVHAKDLKPFQEVKTLEGGSLFITSARKGVEINHVAHVTTADVDCTNGVVHIIDSVLIPKTTPTPSPAPGGNHLYFRSVQYISNIHQCGEVDAAPRMPASLFDPSNAAALKEYEEITVKLYNDPAVFNMTKLEVGRCKDIGYTEPAGTREGVDWAPRELMGPICAEKCHCDYEGALDDDGLPYCKDQPDDPKAGKWCSLCGSKYNQAITIKLFNE